MAFATAKISEMPLRNSLPLTSHSPSSLHLLLKPSFRILKPFSALRTTEHGGNPNARHKSKPSSSSSTAPWLNKWPSRGQAPAEPPRQKFSDRVKESDGREKPSSNAARYVDKDKGQSAIERIVFRLRNLGLGDDEEEEESGDGVELDSMPAASGAEKLGDLLQREWVRPDYILAEEKGDDDVALPWEKEEEELSEDEEVKGMRKARRSKAPSLAELTIEDEELRRLRRLGMVLRERISVPKAGITQAVLEKIHDKWRKEELVRLKFHEVLAHDMKTAHEIVERRTGGLVLWRSGSVMVVYRGSNYKGPSKSEPAGRGGDALFIPDVSSAETSVTRGGNDATSAPDKTEQAVKIPEPLPKKMTDEEAEFNSLLDELGPRFVEYWGTGILPVDADLLPKTIPGYKTPFRLLPTGMRSRLTNAEMTNLRKLAKSIPCHFALGRNRNHQGLASAILKVWEKSSVAKIAVKRGIQNTNNKIMAEELKALTGGVLLLRNKYYIVIYRGKDFVPTTVATALAERQELTKQVQDVEEIVRIKPIDAAASSTEEGQALAGTLAEFYEAQARWGREISAEERKKMIEEDSKAKMARRAKRIEHKLGVAQAKKLRAESLLNKIESAMLPAGPDYDQETITDEERVMFRRVGLRMKAYLPLGIRGVFDGVIENMHLHWKHRELVKLISKQKTLAFVEDSARLLEYESGGILVAIERVPKGYALIYYRGKNYQRPITLRPRNLLTKAKALKRSVAMQRHEALSQHIEELERTIEQMRSEIGISEDVDNERTWGSRDPHQSGHDSEFNQSEDEDSDMESDGSYNDEGSDWEDED
ncbi:PREDICTED: chloroplastic group IIA intron splicing facilitator CRS1, chloroplastic [Fragaria vesca subsp. vesca]|uniref:chloroplastic group IIA intron splicing facilitator CRS1, chloroplastic n=1 Tax=Fragaria vesca subsp. vesca TaxID=101020 RepID=UPI0002C35CCC|nr:PREDICTED: chloroplastic group IIA intron splicing facilitator CRS1, chloroplastic [Fragaria vesca subsp. vesca]